MMIDSTTTTVAAVLPDVVAGGFVASVGTCVGVGLNNDDVVGFESIPTPLGDEEDGPATLSLVGEVVGVVEAETGILSVLVS